MKQHCEFHGEGWEAAGVTEHEGRTFTICQKCADMLEEGFPMFQEIVPATMETLEQDVKLSGWEDVEHFEYETGEHAYDVMAEGAYLSLEYEEASIVGIPSSIVKNAKVTLLTIGTFGFDLVTAPAFVTREGKVYTHFENFC
jgi:hypothetical protein